MKAVERRGEGLRVLVLEDEPGACEAVKRFLQFRGHDVDSALTAVGALDHASRRPPEVAVCDWKLAGEQDGVDAAACLQRRYHTDVILVSAHRMEDLKRKARNAGVSVSAFRRKPLSLGSLADAIEATGRARRAAFVARAS